MSAASSDRNLLFGILALQVNFITREALIKAMHAWVMEKHRTLGDLLVEQGELSNPHCELLEAMVREHLKVHGGDPQKSLAALSSVVSVKRGLLQVADADVQASLGHVGGGADANATDLSVGGPVSSGPRYRKLRAHARGGLGEVFVAVDEELKREVALKEIQEHHADDADSRLRFLLEAEVTGKLEHPGIVPVHGLGSHPDGRPFYAMRFIRGDSLGEAIDRFHKQSFPTPDQRVLELRQLLGRFLDVCDAVAYAHSRGVLHRDLKPGNVMLGRYGETLVVDWGLAKVLGSANAPSAEAPLHASSDSGAARTEMGKAVGTPEYMSPEQAAGRLDELGPASDVYSLGATLYCLLTGRAPFRRGEGGLGELLRRVERGEFPPPHEVNGWVPRALAAICCKAMATKPQDRYATPEALAKDVQQWMADLPTTVYREPWTQRLNRWVRRHRTMVTVATVLLVTLAAGAFAFQRRELENQIAREAADRQTRAEALVEALTGNDVAHVPLVVKGMEPLRAEVDPILREKLAAAAPGSRERVRCALGLLPSDPSLADELFDYLPRARPDEIPVLRDALAGHQSRAVARLWPRLSGEKLDAAARLRLAGLLAGYLPADGRWGPFAPTIAADLVRQNPLELTTWAPMFDPLARPLADALHGRYRDLLTLFKGGGLNTPELVSAASEFDLAAALLARYAADRPDILTDLLLTADDRHFSNFFAPALAHRSAVTVGLRAALGPHPQPTRPTWPDTPRDAAWVEPSAEEVREVEAAGGLLADRFAFVQTLPLDRLATLDGRLRLAGYRPERARPYATPDGPRVAALWHRDGKQADLAIGLTQNELQSRDETNRGKRLLPHDVAGYDTGNDETAVRYAAVWVKAAGTEDARLYAGVPAPAHSTDGWGPLRTQGYHPAAWHGRLGRDGAPRLSGVMAKAAKPLNGYSALDSADEATVRTQGLEKTTVDLSLYPAPPVDLARRRQAALAAAETAVRTKPGDLAALLHRGQARSDAGDDASAFADFDAVAAKAPNAEPVLKARAVVLARLGRAEAARAELAQFVRVSQSESAKAYLAAVVAANLGDDVAALARLDTAITAHAGDGPFLYDAACAYSLASEALAGPLARRVQASTVGAALATDPFTALALGIYGRQQADGVAERSRRYAERAVVLLRQAVAGGYADYTHMQADSDLDPLRQTPAFVAFLTAGAGRRDLRFTGVWHGLTGSEVVSVFPLAREAHRRRANELATEGYHPVSVTAAVISGETLVASVWQRPAAPPAPDGVLEAHAVRQARAAAALLKFGEVNDAWPLLRHSPDPTARSYLIRATATRGVDPVVLMRRYGEEPDVSARRALVLALGEFSPEELPVAERVSLTARLLRDYGGHPDAGLHGAIDWLLRQRWGQAAALGAVHAEVKGKPRPLPESVGAASWFVNGQGQTYTVIRGPVEFIRGSPFGEPGRGERNNEAPHRKRIGRSFAIAAREVTATEYLRFNKNHPYRKQYAPELGGPITDVNWYEAAAYCRWLSEQEGVPPDQMCYPPVEEIKPGMKLPANYLRRTGYRLPTAAEWEYACRAGAVTAYPYGRGAELLSRYAWYQANSKDHLWPTGQLRPTDLGLFDILGNNHEWCHDLATFDVSYEDKEKTSSFLPNDVRFFLGGSFNNRPAELRAAFRYGNLATGWSFTGGFRPARTYRDLGEPTPR